MIVGSQVTRIMQFFLRRNIGIARDRVWDQTVASRGKGPDFWQPYVEEWQSPPRVEVNSKQQKFVNKWLGGWFGLLVVKRGESLSLVFLLHYSSHRLSSSFTFPNLSLCRDGSVGLVQGAWNGSCFA